MNFTIINSYYNNETGLRVCDIMCDSEADLPTAAETAQFFIAPGSWAWIAEERTFKVLNTVGSWV